MATLARPGVQISQVINIEAGSVLVPSLRPCVVGPCFEIVDAIKDGALNTAEALVSISPRIVSGTVSGNLQVSGLSVRISDGVAGSQGAVITLPTIPTPAAGISIQDILNAINKHLEGSELSFVGDKETGGTFVLTSNGSGPNAHLELQPVSTPQVPAAEAYTALGFTADQISSPVLGQAAYSGIEYVIPYTSFTTPHVSNPKEVKFLGDDISLYRNVAGLLTEVSKDSAISWNSQINSASSFDGTAHTIVHTPALAGGRQSLLAKPTAGKSTNTIMGMGTEASVTIPLSTDAVGGVTAQAASGIQTWPDASGARSLTVTAAGLQEFKTSGNNADIGRFPGASGNAITVRLHNTTTGGAWSADAAWNDNTNVLTILALPADTYAVFDARIDAINANLPKTNGKPRDIFLTLTVAPATSLEAGLAWGDTDNLDKFDNNGEVAAAGANPYTLGGGVDAPNFSSDASGAAQQVHIEGAQGIAQDSTGASLGIAGMSMGVSVNGTPEQTITFDGTTVHSQLNALTGITCTENLTNNHAGESFRSLRITGDSTEGHDAMVTISVSDSAVSEALFIGTSAGADDIAAGAPLQSNFWVGVPGAPGANAAFDSRAVHLVANTDYNVNASAVSGQRRLSGAVTLSLTTVTFLPQIETGIVAADLVAGTDLGTIIDAAGAAGLNVSIEFTTGATDQIVLLNLGGSNGAALGVNSHTSAEINSLDVMAAEISGKLLTANVAISASVVDSKLVFSGLDGTLGTAIQINADATLATGEIPGHASSLAWKKALDPATEATPLGGTGTIFSTADDAAGASLITSAAVSADTVLKTTDNTNAWSVTSVSNNLGHIISAGTVGLTSASLSSRLLDGRDLVPVNRFNGPNVTNGTLDVIWAGDAQGATIDVDLPTACITTAQTAGSVTYTREWECSASPVSPGANAYTGAVHQGSSDRAIAGDRLFNNSLSTPVGTITQVQDLSIPHPTGGAPTTMPGAILILDSASQDKLTTYDNWYIQANNLIAGDADESSMRRVEPEANFNDLEGWYRVKPGLNRGSDGIPVTGNTDIYAQYKALRLDVTGSVATPELLVFNSASEVESAIGPINTSNPLAWALYCAFLQGGGQASMQFALGVDDTTADSPEGTIASYLSAFEYLATKEVYAISPLTQNEGVHQLLNAHVTAMSEPENKKERIGLVCPALPTEKKAKVKFSDTFKITPLGSGRFELEAQNDTANIPMSMSGSLNSEGVGIAAGVGASFGSTDGVFLDREGDAFKYLVTKIVSATTIEIDTGDLFGAGMGPASGGNDDAYYKTGVSALEELATFEADGESCSIMIRQAALSKSTSAGKLGICETMAEITGGAAGYTNRRLVFIQPEKVQMADPSGVPVAVPGYYLCAAVGAMVGLHEPAQPFTNFPMVAFTAPIGSNDLFTEPQMATAASGGVYWVVQDVEGGALASRHQLTTDITGLKTRELSIVKSVDYVAKIVRGQVKSMIGKNNITPGLIDTISISIQSALFATIGTAVASAALTKIGVSTEFKDTVACEVAVVPFYPANVIKITIFV